MFNFRWLFSVFPLSYDAGHAQLRSTDAVVVAEGATLLTDDHRVQRAGTTGRGLTGGMIVITAAIVIATNATATVAIVVASGHGDDGPRRKRRRSGR